MTRFTPLRAASFAGLMVLTACVSPAEHPRVIRASRGDTTIVTSDSLGVDGPVALAPQVRIAASAFRGKIAAGAFGPSGSLWIFDDAGADGAITIFDSTGARTGAAGRIGEGPGEYRAPLRLFALANGSMIAKEMSTTRLVRFSSAGEAVATLTLPPEIAGWVVTPDTSGGWYIVAPFEPNTPTRVGRFGWVHFNATGAIIDTVFPPAHLLLEATPDGIAPGRIRTVARDGAVLTTEPGPNRLTRYERGGQVTVMAWPGFPPPYHPDERVAIQAVEDKMSELLGKPKTPLPPYKEPSHRILTDGEGQIWAQLSAPGVPIPKDELPPGDDPLRLTWRDADRWAAFRADGALRFIVTLPQNHRVLDQSGDRLLLAVADDDGAESVVVAQLRRR